MRWSALLLLAACASAPKAQPDVDTPAFDRCYALCPSSTEPIEVVELDEGGLRCFCARRPI